MASYKPFAFNLTNLYKILIDGDPDNFLSQEDKLLFMNHSFIKYIIHYIEVGMKETYVPRPNNVFALGTKLLLSPERTITQAHLDKVRKITEYRGNEPNGRSSDCGQFHLKAFQDAKNIYNQIINERRKSQPDVYILDNNEDETNDEDDDEPKKEREENRRKRYLHELLYPEERDKDKIDWAALSFSANAL
jgi:hypothetical protein